MRLWSLHPGYLDTKGLLALWREALLAQKVLSGHTAGYRNHPQLERFKKHPHPRKAIAAYLLFLWKEAKKRGYAFDRKKIGAGRTGRKIRVTQGQLRYEFEWLCRKLKKRSPRHYRLIFLKKNLKSHPLFQTIKGPVEGWERIKTAGHAGQRVPTIFAFSHAP